MDYRYFLQERNLVNRDIIFKVCDILREQIRGNLPHLYISRRHGVPAHIAIDQPILKHFVESSVEYIKGMHSRYLNDFIEKIKGAIKKPFVIALLPGSKDGFYQYDSDIYYIEMKSPNVSHPVTPTEYNEEFLTRGGTVYEIFMHELNHWIQDITSNGQQGVRSKAAKESGYNHGDEYYFGHIESDSLFSELNSILHTYMAGAETRYKNQIKVKHPELLLPKNRYKYFLTLVAQLAAEHEGLQDIAGMIIYQLIQMDPKMRNWYSGNFPWDQDPKWAKRWAKNMKEMNRVLKYFYENEYKSK